MDTSEEVGARFQLRVRCNGCSKMTTHMLDVPCCEDAPCEVDELLASAFLQRQRFECRHCDGWIGRIIAATQVGLQ